MKNHIYFSNFKYEFIKTSPVITGSGALHIGWFSSVQMQDIWLKGHLLIMPAWLHFDKIIKMPQRQSNQFRNNWGKRSIDESRVRWRGTLFIANLTRTILLCQKCFHCGSGYLLDMCNAFISARNELKFVAFALYSVELVSYEHIPQPLSVIEFFSLEVQQWVQPQGLGTFHQQFLHFSRHNSRIHVANSVQLPKDLFLYSFIINHKRGTRRRYALKSWEPGQNLPILLGFIP